MSTEIKALWSESEALWSKISELWLRPSGRLKDLDNRRRRASEELAIAEQTVNAARAHLESATTALVRVTPASEGDRLGAARRVKLAREELASAEELARFVRNAYTFNEQELGKRAAALPTAEQLLSFQQELEALVSGMCESLEHFLKNSEGLERLRVPAGKLLGAHGFGSNFAMAWEAQANIRESAKYVIERIGTGLWRRGDEP